MNRLVKYLLRTLYKPWLVKYLSDTRSYSYKGIDLKVFPGVFHPGFFYSSKLLMNHIGIFPLKDRTFLEMGAGSGLISLFAARNGALVTAVDINPKAIECLETNRELNAASLNIVHSDLFSGIAPQTFDIVAVNPPYYRKTPGTDAERAWYCGENGEYFAGFFSSLGKYTHGGSDIWMILCDGCDLDMIQQQAGRYGWTMTCSFSKENWIEKNFIFRIERRPAGILRAKTLV